MAGPDPILTYHERDLRAALGRLLTTYADLVGTHGEWTNLDTCDVNSVAALEEQLMRLLASVDTALGCADALLNRACELDLPDALPRSERMTWITDKILGELQRVDR
jgi:hypothetical protein